MNIDAVISDLRARYHGCETFFLAEEMILKCHEKNAIFKGCSMKEIAGYIAHEMGRTATVEQNGSYKFTK